MAPHLNNAAPSGGVAYWDSKRRLMGTTPMPDESLKNTRHRRRFSTILFGHVLARRQ
jgi:hypothetical protein